MKKFVFIGFIALILGSIVAGVWRVAVAALLALLTWLAYETKKRTAFHFLRDAGAQEAVFDLGAEPAQIEISADGSCALFVTRDSALSMRDSQGAELWKMPLERGALAYLAIAGDEAIVATGDELIRYDGVGRVTARLQFKAAPYKQSYALALSADAGCLMLHTPWFLQFFRPDLSASGFRISCEVTGHYMKYASLSPDGQSVAFAGAKLLEEEGQGTEARWGLWRRAGDDWVPGWADAREHYMNSHLRGIRFCGDGSSLMLELHQEGYEVRQLAPDGKTMWSRDRAEHPVMNFDASRVLWESGQGLLTLSDSGAQSQIWSLRFSDKIRHKAFCVDGSVALVVGDRVMRVDASGKIIGERRFQNDPWRFCASADGLSLAVIQQSKGGVLRIAL